MKHLQSMEENGEQTYKSDNSNSTYISREKFSVSMGSIALDWHEEVKPVHEDIKNMQATEAKTPSTLIQCKFMEYIWRFSKRMQTLLETTDEESYL